MATTTTPAGETMDLGNVAAGKWKFASFYTASHTNSYLVKYHRTEAAAAKGHWDSAEMRKVWHYAGHAPIVQAAAK